MSKIREEAQKWSTANERSWEQGAIQRQAQRVLLLEKAVMYQRAGRKLSLRWPSQRLVDNSEPCSKFAEKIQFCWDTAADLIRQAEEV